MGISALLLKKMYSVETFFFLHTDWMAFAKEVLQMEPAGLNRLQRMLRIYYKRFGNVFVLNTDHQQWLTGKSMGFDPARVFLTAHWAAGIFSEGVQRGTESALISRVIPAAGFDRRKPVVLYSGRISKEKGVLELPGIMRMVRSILPEVQMVVAGTGPAEEELKMAMPEAFYSGWVEQEYLQALYIAADILLLPSRFDTFSCVVIEALSCGLPVIAYNTKGPRDIVEDSVNGFLVNTEEEMAGSVVRYFLNPDNQPLMKQAAFTRAESYQADKIMDRLLQDVGMITDSCAL
jgi:glycosyltransferase involved in cell wall biosynthesis